MTEKVQIDIEAKDNASKAIEDTTKALKDIGTVAKDLRDEFGQAALGVQELKKPLEEVSDVVRSGALKDLKDQGVEVFKAIGSAVGEYADIAAEGEQVQARLNIQLKALGKSAPVTADEINNLSEQLMKISGFDDEALVEGQTSLLRFGRLSKEQFEQATRAATDLAAATGMDLASAFRQVGLALESPEQGLGRLKRQIGDLTPVQQAALDQALKMNDTLGAQTIILDALTQKTGGAAAAIGDTWTGKMSIARQETDNFKQSIGDFILNGLNQLPQPLINTGVLIGDIGRQASSVIGPVSDLVITLRGLGGLSGVFGASGSATTAMTAAAGTAGGFVGLALAAGIVASAEAELARTIGVPEWLTTILTGGISGISGGIRGLFAPVGEEAGKGVAEGYANSGAGDAMVETSASWLDQIKAFFGISSPSTTMATEVGQPVAEGIASGASQVIQGVAIKTAREFLDSLQAALGPDTIYAAIAGQAETQHREAAAARNAAAFAAGIKPSTGGTSNVSKITGRPAMFGAGSGLAPGQSFAPTMQKPTTTNNVTVNLEYNTQISLSDKEAVTKVLVPYIRDAMRQLGVATSG